MLDELGIGMGESVPEAPKEMHAKEQKSGEKHRGEIDICGKEFFFYSLCIGRSFKFISVLSDQLF